MDTTHANTETVRIQANYRTVKKFGNWTTARGFDIHSRRGMLVLDFRSPAIPDGDLDLNVELDHALIKLLLPTDAVLDDWDLRWIGRGRVKDHQPPTGQAGRRVRITGQIRHGEIRVHRGDLAVASVVFTREFFQDAYRAHREGRQSTLPDPAA